VPVLAFTYGNTENHTAVEWVYDEASSKMVKKEIAYNPGLIKIISEVIDNSVDEHKRSPAKLNVLKVNLDKSTGVIEVYDNGGIPVKIHAETNMYVPEMIFGYLGSSSNYNDDEDQSLIGTNGLGAKLASIFSDWFIVETCDGTQYFKQEHKNGMHEKSVPKIKEGTKNHTKISFKPDLKYFECSFDDDLVTKVFKRVVDISACNPNLKCYFNGKQIKINSFKDYVSLYDETFEIDENNSDFLVGISPGNDGFQQVSFVNAVETYDGGTHVDYVVNGIVNEIREYIKKKNKIDVKPADIKNQLQVYISCNINRPKFNSQTKAFMISEPKNFGTTYSPDKKFINKILKSPILQNILDWVTAKQAAIEKAELRKLNKNLDKANPKLIEKFIDATYSDRSECILALVEGDSAASGPKNNRPNRMGVFPLRGKPINVYEMSPKEVIENKEFKNIMTILGLQIGVSPIMDASDNWLQVEVEGTTYVVNGSDRVLILGDKEYHISTKEPGHLKVKVLNNEYKPSKQEQLDYDKLLKSKKIMRKTTLRFGKIAIMSDADNDGYHIRGLIANMFFKYWPELFDLGMVYLFETPIVRAKVGKKRIEFYTLDDFEQWKSTVKEKYVSEYLKGLGSSDDADWKQYLSEQGIEQNMIQLKIVDDLDKGIFKLLFSKEKGMTDRRKEWLEIAEKKED
jgi:DNA gyrase/topoisomerase IV subunit B